MTALGAALARDEALAAARRIGEIHSTSARTIAAEIRNALVPVLCTLDLVAEHHRLLVEASALEEALAALARFVDLAAALDGGAIDGRHRAGVVVDDEIIRGGRRTKEGEP